MKLFVQPLRWTCTMGAFTLIGMLPIQQACSAPAIDGLRDATGYSLVASSEKNNLISYTDGGGNPVNDNTNPRTEVCDITDLYMGNDGNALYIWIGLPHYDLNTAQGDICIAVHAGGANDSLAIPQPVGGPFNGAQYFNYPVGPNAVFTENFKSRNTSGDGSNGFGDFVTINAAGTGWDFGDVAGTRNYFAMDGVAIPVGATALHSVGHTGAELGIQNGDLATAGNPASGFEFKIPLADWNHNGLTPPKPGDTLSIQVTTTARESNGDHKRGPVDNVPFEPASRFLAGTDPPDTTTGITTLYATYTLVAPTALEVSNASFVDITHLAVNFTDSVGAGGNVAANYVLVDESNGNAPVSVSAAAVNGTIPTRVDLTTATLDYGHKYLVTVSGVRSVGGALLSATKNSAEVQLPVAVTFELCDNATPPLVGAGLEVTLTGNFIGWVNGPTAAEVVLTPEAGSPTCYKSDTVYILPGPIDYKVRIARTDWDTLNRRNHTATIVAPGPQAINDVVGAPVNVTFNLTVYPDKAIPAGRDVYATGDWNGYSADLLSTTPPIKLNPPSAGATTGVFLGSGVINQNIMEYKYVLIDPTGALGPDFDYLNANPRTGLYIKGSGLPLAQTVFDFVGTPPAQTAAAILRVAAGLAFAPTPPTDPAFTAMDKDGNNAITILDAVKAIKP